MKKLLFTTIFCSNLFCHFTYLASMYDTKQVRNSTNNNDQDFKDKLKNKTGSIDLGEHPTANSKANNSEKYLDWNKMETL